MQQLPDRRVASTVPTEASSGSASQKVSEERMGVSVWVGGFGGWARAVRRVVA
jgi:hypothetical protein